MRHGPLAVPMRAHLRYLRREGVTRDGTRPQFFDAAGDAADDRGFVERCADDRHHFRFMVSPEDGVQMGDLRGYTRDLMAQVERDLGTRLDWVALDHWNTDNPHVLLVVRGRTDRDTDLLISRDYISRGMRMRAANLVTLELGPRSELEIEAALRRDVLAERWTRLDQAIVAAAGSAGVIDMRPAENAPLDGMRGLMIGRLQQLERMHLAQPTGVAQWQLRSDAQEVLRDLGTRGDIVKTMHRALTESGQQRPASDLLPHASEQPVEGRVLAKGLADEVRGTGYLVVDGMDGPRASHRAAKRACARRRAGRLHRARSEGRAGSVGPAVVGAGRGAGRHMVGRATGQQRGCRGQRYGLRC